MQRSIFIKEKDLKPTSYDPKRSDTMCAAQEDMDRIHEAETVAEKQIKAAEVRSREIKDSADLEAKKIIDQAEQDGKREAERLMQSIHGDKSKVESTIFQDTEKTISKLEASAQEKQKAAVEAVVRIILGEE
jgi:vacuolar-type H+-ATPase subunit H